MIYLDDEEMEGVEVIEPREVQILEPNAPQEVQIIEPIEPIDFLAVQDDRNADLQEIQIENAGGDESESEEEPAENSERFIS